MGGTEGAAELLSGLPEKVRILKAELERTFPERHDEIAGALLGLLSGEHVLFLGPPGTAKSLLARKLCEAVDGGSFFYYLLTRFTTPDEVFGPLSVQALREDRYSRKTDGYLPTSHVAFLDEIFKANSSILNALLTVLNERKFHNGSEVVDVPLLSVVGASNEPPEEEENLGALYDRFLFRFDVRNVQDEENFQKVVFGDAEDYRPAVRLGVEETRALGKQAEGLQEADEVIRILLELRKLFRSENVQISDRRWKKIVKVLKTAAAGAGRAEVDRTMALLMQHMLWDKPEQREAIRSLVMDLVVAGGVSLDSLKKDVEELRAEVGKASDDTLPVEVRCTDCGRTFNKWGAVKEHKKGNSSHDYTFESPQSKRF